MGGGGLPAAAERKASCQTTTDFFDHINRDCAQIQGGDFLNLLHTDWIPTEWKFVVRGGDWGGKSSGTQNMWRVLSFLGQVSLEKSKLGSRVLVLDLCKDVVG